MRSRRVFLLSVFALLLGCASSTAQFSGLAAPDQGKAVIYIYRVDLYTGNLRVAPNVRVNYQSIGTLMKFGYFRIEVDPGPTHVALYRLDRGDDSDIYWPAAKDAFVNLQLAPNSMYFIELSLDRRIFSLRETSRDTALRSLPDLYRLN